MNKNYQSYSVKKIYKEVEDTYILQVNPKEGEIVSYQPGQYVFLKNPQFDEKSDEEHPFSIASSPKQKEYLEFCIKVYGDWTEKIKDLKPQDTIFVSRPCGDFTWDDKLQYAIFLLGGIGISPIISMLRYMRDTGQSPKVTLLYGNRTPDTIAYKDELIELKESLPLTIIDIFSHLPENHPWKGYRGFITKDIIQKETPIDNNPTFFIVGPQVFVDLMNKNLHEMGIENGNIRQELLTEKKPGI